MKNERESEEVIAKSATTQLLLKAKNQVGLLEDIEHTQLLIERFSSREDEILQKGMLLSYYE